MKAIWGALPPKHGDPEIILRIIVREGKVTPLDLQKLSGISKTRILCALGYLESRKTIVKSKGKYSITLPD